MTVLGIVALVFRLKFANPIVSERPIIIELVLCRINDYHTMTNCSCQFLFTGTLYCHISNKVGNHTHFFASMVNFLLKFPISPVLLFHTDNFSAFHILHARSLRIRHLGVETLKVMKSVLCMYLYFIVRRIARDYENSIAVEVCSG